MKSQYLPNTVQALSANQKLRGQRLQLSHSANELRKGTNRVLLNNANGLHSSDYFTSQIRVELIGIAEGIVHTLFQCGEPKGDKVDQESLPKLSEFILKVVRRTNTSHSTLLIALMYLIRLKQRHPGCKGTYGSGHRLLLASIIVATKYLYDDAYYNKTWALVSNGMFTIKEINQMEFELLYFLNFRLHISVEQWNDFVHLMDEKISRNWRKSGKPDPTGRLIDHVCNRFQAVKIQPKPQDYQSKSQVTVAKESLTLETEKLLTKQRVVKKPLDVATLRHPASDIVHKRLSMPVLPHMWSLLPQSVFAIPK